MMVLRSQKNLKEGNVDKKPKIIPVSQEEAPLIYAAKGIENKLYAESRAREEEASREAGKTLRDPLLLYNTPEEAKILSERDSLVRKYKETLDLDVDPILTLPMPPGQEFLPRKWGWASGQFHQYQRKDGGQLAQIEMVELFLEKVPVRRQDGILYVWTGNHFRRASDGDLRGLIGEVLREELRYTNASSTIGSILSLLQSERRIRVEPNLRSTRIALHNGVLDLLSLNFRKASPNVFNTYFLDSCWHDSVPCPVFQSFLWTISGGSPLLVQRILEAIGFLLAPGNEAKRFVLLQGVPNSGKSVIGNLVQTFFLPGDVAGLPLHQFGDRFAMSAIAGRHLNVSMDLPSGVIDGKAAATIKQITGGDLVYVESKGKEGYGRHIQCKFLFGSNHPVELKSRDQAFAERILLIPFRISIPEGQRDTGLIDKLCQEKPGILYQSLKAYREVIRRNYQFAGENEFGFRLEEIAIPEQPANHIASFVSRHCQLFPEAFTSTEALHLAFMDFCREAGCPTILDRAAFSRTLRLQLAGQIEPLKRRVNGTPMNGYTGIQLNP